ncbi:MAG: ComEC family competence protein [Candidatus Pacebacteria bacterium]|nr:ComEC family competence protein [Candidatus Paceibacterota bacterium]
MSISWVFFFSLLCCVLGLISSLFLPKLWLLSGFFIFLSIAFYKKDISWILLFLVFVFGFLRGSFVVENLQKSPLLGLNNSQKDVVLQGRIIGEPEIKDKFQRFVFQPEDIFGKVLVYTSKETKYTKGEEIKIKGELRTPQKFKNFDWQKYLKRKGILSVVYYPEILKIKNPQAFWQVIFHLKEKARKMAEEHLPQKESYLFRAIILGDKKDLPKNLKEDFNKTGIRHITAISGMHIMILIKILMGLFLSLGFWRKQAGIFAIFAIFLYLFFVGFQPSIVRASIMGAGLILAQIFGKLPDSIRFLLFAACLMLIINPLVFYDIGFQLSFLAALGINYLGSFFYQTLKIIPKEFQIRTILSMNFAVYIFTLPLLLYYFSYFPFISILANILILPILPLILGFGFLATFLGFIFPLISIFVFFPLSLLLAYIIFLASHLAKLSFLGIHFQLPLILAIIYYGILIFFVRELTKKERYWFLEY